MFPASMASPHKYAHNTENIYLFTSNPDPELLKVLNFKFCCTWVAVAPILQGDLCGAIRTSGKYANISDVQRRSPKVFLFDFLVFLIIFYIMVKIIEMQQFCFKITIAEVICNLWRCSSVLMFPIFQQKKKVSPPSCLQYVQNPSYGKLGRLVACGGDITNCQHRN